LQDIVVLKFGSSVLRTAADLPAAVHEIYRWYREGSRVLAVVSAIGETTEQLLHQAREFSAAPEPRATARLLATGEQTSAALLGIALDRVGVPCRVLDPRDIGLTVAGGPLDSEAIGVDAQRLQMALDQCPVVVLPGFFGHAPDGSLHLLGRGGSDLSAVFLACSLRAQRCRLLKDVDGVYEFDPARASSPPRRYTRLGYADALRVAGSLIQTKAVAFLASCGMTAEVAALGAAHESLVHSGPTVRAAIQPPQPPSRVLLLGLGTVGLGVYRRLLAVPQLFEPLGALVRHRGKHEAAGVPVKLLHSSEDAVLASQPDIVVDALPGGRVSQRLVGDFLSRGVDVVTANKALIADHGAALMKARHKGGSLLRFSAAVGGSAPMIEAVCMAARRGPVQAIAGVLNGTCNYLLERCALGASFEETLADAQARGFAEADPTEDLSGRDAERKLRILAEHAFGEPLLDVTTELFTVEQGHAACEASRRGSSLRQVASVRRDRGRLSGRVAFEVLAREHPLALVSGEWNALVVTHSDGRSLKVVGRGAGRWPTSEAVVADLLEVRRARQSANRRAP
jgi:homoserine dehydrogenase